MSEKTTLPHDAVAIEALAEYDSEKILACLRREADAIGIPQDAYKGKRVVIKPNLVAPTKPDGAATTHPAFLKAVVAFLRERGATDLLLAESPGGPYTEVTLRHNYKTCGILSVAEETLLPLNYETGFQAVHAPHAKACRAFSVIDPITEADVIVDLCRLKSHSLTKMSAGIKNLFGVVPGIQKFEMHSAYPTVPLFSEMIVDLCEMLCETHEVLTICDGIIGMEGNGPTGGTPREIGAVLMSHSPFCLDLAAETLIGFEKSVPITEAAKARGLCPLSADELTIYGEMPARLAVSDFREPDATRKTFLGSLSTLFGGRLADFFAPRPVISAKKCIGCGVCVNSCPRHTIEFKTVKRKKKAVIRYDGCIRCFCCQELCPAHIIDIRKNSIIRLLH